jgi:hypothetical protein
MNDSSWPDYVSSPIGTWVEFQRNPPLPARRRWKAVRNNQVRGGRSELQVIVSLGGVVSHRGIRRIGCGAVDSEIIVGILQLEGDVKHGLR